jgi:hypothetical protein
MGPVPILWTVDGRLPVLVQHRARAEAPTDCPNTLLRRGVIPGGLLDSLFGDGRSAGFREGVCGL